MTQKIQNRGQEVGGLGQKEMEPIYLEFWKEKRMDESHFSKRYWLRIS